MDERLWALFRETGEPMGYLLCKAEERTREKRGDPQPGGAPSHPAPPMGPPPASN